MLGNHHPSWMTYISVNQTLLPPHPWKRPQALSGYTLKTRNKWQSWNLSWWNVLSYAARLQNMAIRVRWDNSLCCCYFCLVFLWLHWGLNPCPVHAWWLPYHHTRPRFDNPKQKDFWPLGWKLSCLIVFLSAEPGLDKQNTYIFKGQCQANITKGDLIRPCFVCDRHGLLVQWSSLLFLGFLLWLKKKINYLVGCSFIYCCLPFQTVYN